MVACTIEWVETGCDRWIELFRATRRSTLTQHIGYAAAARETQQMGVRHGLIQSDADMVGLVQIGEVGILGNAIHAVTLDRGPLFLDRQYAKEYARPFFQEFRRQFPRRLGRKCRVLPELEATLASGVLSDCGFHASERYSSYPTAWLDLTADPDALRKGLNGKWRNVLARSERAELGVEVDERLETLSTFLKRHAADKEAKAYEGPSERMLRALVRYMGPRGEVLLLNAKVGEDAIAAMLILVHGLSATYQVGWTTPLGRDLGAHHRILWQALLVLKSRGVMDLDLGGLTGQANSGLDRFKLGTGATQITLGGLYS